MGKRDEQRKLKMWKLIYNHAQSLGLVPPTKDWTYVRDVWWLNVKKATMEKVDNYKKTGTGGGPEKKLTDVDEEVLDVLDKESPAIHGLGLEPQPMSEDIIEIQETATAGHETNKEKKEKLQMELLKVEIYKTRLEARQLEISLGLPESEFTKDLQANDTD
ncbi:hypothetical protein Zmor_014905 [Zophobas morio]|uniref:Regulatory protein zeste n=1 Tax=Zophobas morio TaxID=2755281 RepID=A0AA38MGP6_9CUCU|nr:hypothetical protein Zmor_014905 [Zophobas morio]